MVDTRVQLKVEKWVRDHWLTEKFSEEFQSRKLKLVPGGTFEFDAVNKGESIVAVISTSSRRTANNRFGTGKFMKLRSDMLFLTMLERPCIKLMILVDEAMHAECLKQQESGRTPRDISFLFAEIPDALRLELIEARSRASKEVTPVIAEAGLPDEVLLGNGDG